MATKRATPLRLTGKARDAAAKKAEEGRVVHDEVRMLREEIARLEQQCSVMRHRMRGTTSEQQERRDSDFLGIDVGTHGISWARLDGEQLDDFDTVELRSKKQTLDEARRALRLKLPDMLSRWCDGGLPTVIGIEEPMFSVGTGAIHTSKALNTFKTMIEEALFAQGHVVVSVTPARWHAVVRSLASQEQMSKFNRVKRGRRVLDIKALAAELADIATRGSSARAGMAGDLLQDECDAFWIAQRARFDYESHTSLTDGEA